MAIKLYYWVNFIANLLQNDVTDSTSLENDYNIILHILFHRKVLKKLWEIHFT